jgi:hydroxymethylbilane synthase
VSKTIHIGTRGSKLALWQAHWVESRLRELCPDLATSVEIVQTTGDAVQDRPLADLGVKGSFTKELDRALLAGEVNLVVHSLKDMPTDLVGGLALAAVPERADARDVFIGKEARSLAELPPGAVVGTGSLRRRAQLKSACPGIETADVRGNIDTRIRKLKESNTLAGIILAAAGVARLGLADEVTQVLEYEAWLPAPGQGALGVVVREDDAPSLNAAVLLDDSETRMATTAERALLARLEGGCHVPVGAYARPHEGGLLLDGLVADPDGGRLVRSRVQCETDGAKAAGEALAEKLLSMGGDDILTNCERRM